MKHKPTSEKTNACFQARQRQRQEYASTELSLLPESAKYLSAKYKSLQNPLIVYIEIHCSRKTVAEPVGSTSTLPVLGHGQIHEFWRLMAVEQSSSFFSVKKEQKENNYEKRYWIACQCVSVCARGQPINLSPSGSRGAKLEQICRYTEARSQGIRKGVTFCGGSGGAPPEKF